MTTLKILSTALCLCLLNCSAPQDEVLVLIGDEPITAAELRDFERQKQARNASEPLQDLIDRKLLLLDARAQGTAEAPAFGRQWKRARRKLLIASYRRERYCRTKSR